MKKSFQLGDRVVVLAIAFPSLMVLGRQECEIVGITDGGESLKVRTVRRIWFRRFTAWVGSFSIEGKVIGKFPDGTPRTAQGA